MKMDSLKTYFEGLSCGKRFTIEEQMQYGLLRLESFNTWPQWAAKRPTELADSGFYYCGSGDRVKCFACGGELADLLPLQDVTKEHQRRFPWCPLVSGRAADKNERLESGAGPRDEGNLHEVDQLLKELRMCGMVETRCTSQSTCGQDLVELPRYEWYRLDTFKERWTNHLAPTPVQLANAGFYFVGPQDTVKCAFCDVTFQNWKSTDDPITEHKKHNPRCPFLINKPVSGSSYPRNNIKQFKVNSQILTHPEFAAEELRLQTFANWPKNDVVKPERLAEAGFYYLGHSDNVKCFSCNGGLRNWEVTDDPWREHARWYHKCIFLREKKGEDFVQMVLHQSADRTQTGKHDDSPKTGGSQLSDPHSSGTDRKTKSTESRPVTEPSGRRESGLSRRQKRNKNKKKKSGQSAGEEMSEVKLVPVKDKQEVNVNTGKRNDDEKLVPSAEYKDKDILDERLCKICMDAPCDVVFLPCRHMMCCSECAPILRTCPVCRSHIKDRIKVYIP